MSNDQNPAENSKPFVFFEDEIQIRGCALSLAIIKSAYKELQSVIAKEAEKVINSLLKPDELSPEEFEKRNDFLRVDAFRLTVSIIGFDRQTAYGDTAEIFDSNDLPNPIKNIYFTNITAYQKHANGTEPNNNFSVSLYFDKPPLFDPSPLVSQPTVNASKATIKADDIVFYRAVQNIINTKIKEKRTYYSIIHEKFSYDLGLWLFAR